MKELLDRKIYFSHLNTEIYLSNKLFYKIQLKQLDCYCKTISIKLS